ncbi:MAG TPA: BadF/BadG/BcrA/BcrD ATPase family protein, partial [Methylomirabilota bacterium]|nr:BadF/BadG/BcrA/BcrD ATPase family protein [Methylomirabilota bacterium]
MSQTRPRPRPLAVGVDLGGTWLRLAILRNGEIVRRTRRTIPISELSRFLRTQAGRRVASLVVAARGVWTPAERRAAARRLRGVAARVQVISDAEAALLGAHDGSAGVLVLAGTGSIVLGRDERGRLARAGGLGPLLGDEGSAFWLGRQWLRATPERALTARALARGPDAVARVAALAPRVLAGARRGDRRARAIVAEGQSRLAALAADVIRRLRLRRPVRVSWGGSLLANAAYRA